MTGFVSQLKKSDAQSKKPSLAGRSSSVSSTLGVTIDHFVKEKLDFKHDDPSRYEEENLHLGTVAELYAVVPENFMTYLEKI